MTIFPLDSLFLLLLWALITFPFLQEKPITISSCFSLLIDYDLINNLSFISSCFSLFGRRKWFVIHYLISRFIIPFSPALSAQRSALFPCFVFMTSLTACLPSFFFFFLPFSYSCLIHLSIHAKRFSSLPLFFCWSLAHLTANHHPYLSTDLSEFTGCVSRISQDQDSAISNVRRMSLAASIGGGFN